MEGRVVKRAPGWGFGAHSQSHSTNATPCWSWGTDALWTALLRLNGQAPCSFSLWLVNVLKDHVLITNGVKELQAPSQRLVGNQLRNSLIPSLASLVAER